MDNDSEFKHFDSNYFKKMPNNNIYKYYGIFIYLLF